MYGAVPCNKKSTIFLWLNHRNLISRIGIRPVVGFFTVQWNGASVVGKGKEEKFIFLTK
jgi:hypothetical protein